MAASKAFPGLPKDWKEHQLSTASDQIHVRIYHKDNFGQGRMLFLVHGQAEQSDRYQHFAHYLRSVVDIIACVDLPGHGLSKGIRGHIENFDQYSQACLQALQASKDWTAKQTKITKLHWFGHSLGGLITLRTLFRNPHLELNSVTVSAPLLDLAISVPKVKAFFSKLVEPILGKITLYNELDVAMVSRDPSVVSEYSANKLNHNLVTPRFFVHLLEEMQETQKTTLEFAYPLLEIIPLGDRIVSWKAEWGFFQRVKMAAGKVKEMVSLPAYYHESFNDLGKERAFVALEAWLSSK